MNLRDRLKTLTPELKLKALEVGRKLITDEEFNDTLRQCSLYTKDYLLKNNVTALPPTIVVVTKEEENKLIKNVMPLPTDKWNQDRYLLMRATGLSIAEMNYKPIMFMLISEVWGLFLNSDSSPKDKDLLKKIQAGEMRVSESAQKQEAIIAYASTIDLLRTGMVTMTMSRGPKQEILIKNTDIKSYKDNVEAISDLVDAFIEGYVEGTVAKLLTNKPLSDLLKSKISENNDWVKRANKNVWN